MLHLIQEPYNGDDIMYYSGQGRILHIPDMDYATLEKYQPWNKIILYKPYFLRAVLLEASEMD